MIVRFETNLNTNSTFYTDDGGRDFQQRIYQTKRGTAKHLISNVKTISQFTTQSIGGVEANYYPSVSAAFIVDTETNYEMAVLSRQTHGCSSATQGSLEFMLHRRIMNEGLLKKKKFDKAFSEKTIFIFFF